VFDIDTVELDPASPREAVRFEKVLDLVIVNIKG
jgi:hypothetical protein